MTRFLTLIVVAAPLVALASSGPPDGYDQIALGRDRAVAVATDPAGGFWVVGETSSPDFPVTPAAAQPIYRGGASIGSDLFVAHLAPDGRVLYATYLGGAEDDF